MGLFSRKPTIQYLPELDDDVAVVGTSYRQKEIGGACGTFSFQLVAEPTNPHDSNAVKVMFGGKQVGFLPADRAKPLSRLAQQLAKEHTAVWVPGEVREGDSGFWILLRVPREATIDKWLKG